MTIFKRRSGKFGIDIGIDGGYVILAHSYKKKCEIVQTKDHANLYFTYHGLNKGSQTGMANICFYEGEEEIKFKKSFKKV